MIRRTEIVIIIIIIINYPFVSAFAFISAVFVITS